MARDREQPYRSMDAPGVTFFRVLVMLSCLILVPLAAIFGSQFPELVKTTLIDRVQAFLGEHTGTAKASTAPAAASDAPPFDGPASGTPAPSAEPAYSAPAYSSPSVPSGIPDAHAATNAYPTTTLGQSPHYEGVQASGNAPAASSNVNAAGAWEPAPIALPHEAQGYAPPVAPQAATQPPSSTDYFTDIQHRLRSYGATHYALETSGERGELYRFHCTVDTTATEIGQKFEATDVDPLQAMARVLKMVEEWRRLREQDEFEKRRASGISVGFGR